MRACVRVCVCTHVHAHVCMCVCVCVCVYVKSNVKHVLSQEPMYLVVLCCKIDLDVEEKIRHGGLIVT